MPHQHTTNNTHPEMMSKLLNEINEMDKGFIEKGDRLGMALALASREAHAEEQDGNCPAVTALLCTLAMARKEKQFDLHTLAHMIAPVADEYAKTLFFLKALLGA